MNHTLPSKFTIRVYGLFINEKNEVLITDEFQLGMKMTKFPGGGMNFGEGPVDCLRREMMEECNQPISATEHFYTTEFYQKALFYNDHQLISIYYMAQFDGPIQFKISDRPFDFEELKNGNQSFRWAAVKNLNPEEFTFPIDKHVANLLKQTITQE
ncbi:MAG: NUDIX hydrolase [Bacteroidetes bacterium GWF2_42_66]|nr:MAG: NUDIX hydrolase [Bacteroidetes bacterium GWA2_42_15]OFX99919.1 MAG: NUDIX hydrolase [Bacteroidetes bacterium GWE2_42_39]OFY40104.1 MAG: NUDIX hydrolase [Bacteroidetes bacterium GWF2_42_66]HBL73926.1 NUDIX hydrolase [Prolixibacteraceae bacterium]HCR89264.1 NUDIX hydrolase [Prolixibacteraceae bacterium]